MQAAAASSMQAPAPSTELKSPYASLFTGIHPEWARLIKESPELVDALRVGVEAVHQSRIKGETVVPPVPLILEALRYFPPTSTKVVIVGQDPYHAVIPIREGGELVMRPQAHGLSFSCNPRLKTTQPSLRNIYKAVVKDTAAELGMDPAALAPTLPQLTPGCLQYWAAQGVLLLNRGLTTIKGTAKAHLARWEHFTKLLLLALVKKCGEAKVAMPIFMLWGGPAKELSLYLKTAAGERRDLLLLEWTHPSPFNDRLPPGKHFADCGHFLKANQWLRATERQSVEWLSFPIMAATDGGCSENGKEWADAGYGFTCQIGFRGIIECAGPVRKCEYRFVDPANPLAGFRPVEGAPHYPATNNRAEYLAFCYLMLALGRLQSSAPKTVILDSNLVIQTLQEWLPGWRKRGVVQSKKNPDLVLIADALWNEVKKTSAVELKHINSHRKAPPKEQQQDYLNWYLNDRADKLAGEGEKLPAIRLQGAWFPCGSA
jgi:uracil-DNA glycosylase